ncbi:hypothetical protein PMG11_07095 [Penicillium brasilianum]|uniref:Zn(2)-C6 fungal-type domain-containing protein n=1 Tax=Penicillium brasilianum TaxID=104259 RepID=A0A0F7TSS2_PENBI|nr:hypothetical protein PMG11_07095 [Penicillium brasilianum]
MTGSSRRVSKGRSRTGCVTCKIRRVKCDEQKPACLKCVSTGRTCGGYPDPQGHSRSGSPAPGDTLRIIQHIPGILQPTRMWQVPQSPELVHEAEYRALEFFQLHTKNCFGSQIGTFLLQAVFNEPIIRTVAIAIGSLHRTFVFDQQGLTATRETTQFTLLNYNKAIRQLVAVNTQNSPQTNDTFLIACILFFCFECLQSNYKSAFRHAISGLKIIKQQHLLSDGATLSRYMPPETITLLFGILENQILEIDGDEIVESELRPAILSSFQYDAIDRSRPPSKVQEFLASFQVLYNRFTRFEAVCEILEDSVRDHAFEFVAQAQYIQTEYFQILSDLKVWVAIFDDWVNQPKLHNDDDTFLVSILKVWRTTIGILISLEWPPSELSWDKFTVDFATVISVVAEMFGVSATTLFMRSSSPGSPSPDEPPPLPTSKPLSLPPLRPKPAKTVSSTFSLSLGVVTPLYICATRCRESSTRHQALFLLSYCQRREGLWDSDLAGRIANRIVRIEETAANISPGTEYHPSDILLSSRVRSLSPQFDEQKRIKVRYNREGDKTGFTEEVFTW